MSKKSQWKKQYKKCAICDCDNYDILDTHRLDPGKDGGKYTKSNIIILCANDHRRCHSGELEILRKYKSTIGEVIIYKELGIEKIKII